MFEDVARRKLHLPDSGIDIAVLDWGGEGPLALLHHANGFCAGVWGLVAEALTPHYRVVAMDARGHGDSSKPAGAEFYHWRYFGEDVAQVAELLLAERNDDRVALGLGHSFGGTSILMASAHRPDLFARSVLVDPVIRPPADAMPNPEAASQGSSLAEGARKRRHIWPDRAAARAKWIGKDFFDGWDPRALDLYLAEGLRDRADGQVELKCPGEVEAAIFESGGSVDIWELAGRVVTPTLLLRAVRGNFPAVVYESLVALMPHGRLAEIEAGHLAVMERPELVVSSVLEFAGLGSALDG
jgi:pimeloyl-ACP methyl ester carboxylesterase